MCFFTQTCLLTRLVIGHKISNLIANLKDTNTLSVKLKPVFEHLRQIKLQKEQEFLANVQALTGTLEKRSNSAKQILKNIHPNVNEIKGYGTRQKLLNTKIEPLHGDSKKLNVVNITILEPMIPDKNTCSPAGMSVYTELVRIIKIPRRNTIA